MIPRINLKDLISNDPSALAQMRDAATVIGFATVHNTDISEERVRSVLACYAAFFALPEREKAAVDMARTGGNRGWGGSGSEQVNPDANPDYKQFYDCGFTLPAEDPRSGLDVYAPNLWPMGMPEFKAAIEAYYTEACGVAMSVLRGVTHAVGLPSDFFDGAFEAPMALLRGNYYPARPDSATDSDFGIATHTDYGCLTLLATDGAPGLEVRKRGGGWIPVSAPPGEFVINFGEMMEIWSDGLVRATPHRVVGTRRQRLSVPLFFNPSVDTNIAAPGSGQRRMAGDHMSRRFRETYVHLKDKDLAKLD